GAFGSAGEIGHWTVNPALVTPAGNRQLDELQPRVPCTCKGHGHLQAYASMRALANRLQRHWPPSSASAQRPVGGAAEYEAIFEEMLIEWDAIAPYIHDPEKVFDARQEALRHGLRQSGQLLGQALVNLTLLFSPEIIVVTGRMALFG